jgi:hypothetical protein
VSDPATDADTVRLTVRGRLGPDLVVCFDDLDIERRPRHTVLVTGSDDISDLISLLRALERRGVLVDRIT